ncbi:hypothetical protein [Aliagarivorans taiwanensis]|uniref:hypothetical protein n=1 Tax=Aliagarivorans taiwanensis TaxID=561966 RepID=UPI00040C42F5|nr:hypothetical protein [Aliagarivorans taiwanensis]
MHCSHLEALIAGNSQMIVGDKQLSKSYYDKLRSLLSRYQQEHGSPGEDISAWFQLVNFAIERIATTNQHSGWRIYRGALNQVLNAYLQVDPPLPESSLTSLRHALANLANTRGLKKTDVKVKSADDTQRRTKAKRISVEDLYTLRRVVKSDDDQFAIDWLEFTVLCNLRPNELRGAFMLRVPASDGGYIPVLYAPNTAKSSATQVRQALNDDERYRQIPLDALSFAERRFVSDFMVRYHAKCRAVGDPHAVFETSRKRLYTLTNNHLGFSISLSVGRTQFAANLKRAEIDEETLANLMGHTDVSRAKRSYGRKSFGWGGVARQQVASAEEEEVSDSGE